ncbi:MAG: putative toxin-antitoxin system toxin component, PIN family [Planctomycetota bacterium]
MRAVLDTNVVVSAALTPHGVCAQILDLLTDGAFALCADDRILDEYEAVLYRPALRIVPGDAAIVLELIRSVVEIVPAYPLPVELPDPHDAPFLEVAASADAVLVTGNLRHYPSEARAGVTAVTPAEFLALLRRCDPG